MSALPLPPHRPGWGQFVPMTEDEAIYWVNSYNAWVEVWNRHERDRNLPLNPEWPEAASIVIFSPRDAISFTDRWTGLTAIMRIKGFETYHKGFMNCLRHTIDDTSKIVWAGWQMPHKRPRWKPHEMPKNSLELMFRKKQLEEDAKINRWRLYNKQSKGDLSK